MAAVAPIAARFDFQHLRRAAGGIAQAPIDHLIVLMQENRSFDHYFGRFPDADGIPAGTAPPQGTGWPSRGRAPLKP